MAKPRPVNRWHPKDASRAYVIGYTAVGDDPKRQSDMAPTHYRFSAAVFHQAGNPPAFLMWWCAEGLGLGGGISNVYCGARTSRKEAERDARGWVETVRMGATESDMSAIGTFEEFADLHGLPSFVIETLRAAPDVISAEAFSLWDAEREGVRRAAIEVGSEEFRWSETYRWERSP